MYIHTHTRVRACARAFGARVEAEAQTLPAGSNHDWGPYLFQVLFPGWVREV